jgi:hypothetical protein
MIAHPETAAEAIMIVKTAKIARAEMETAVADIKIAKIARVVMAAAAAISNAPMTIVQAAEDMRVARRTKVKARVILLQTRWCLCRACPNSKFD